MIGQNNLKSWVNDNLKNIPSFIIIIGGRGCGKRTLAKYIANKCNLIYSESDIKVEAVRDVIQTAYKVSSPVLYCFADCDNMRNEAKNALLKVTEEPPNEAKFIMTVCDESKILDTLKSRATVLRLQSYSMNDIVEYSKKYPDTKLRNVAVNSSPNPRIFDCIMNYGEDFIDYVQLVAQNICQVQSANAFKSSSKLALKANSEGYDLEAFWLMFNYFMYNEIWANVDKSKVFYTEYAKAVLITDEYLAKVNTLGVNKQQLYDSWVFRIRELDI